MKNLDLRWYESEEPEILGDMIDKYFYDTGPEFVNDMLSELRDDQKTSAEHVKERHMSMGIKAMVIKALHTGQKQGTFMDKNRKILSKENVHDTFIDAVYDKLQAISEDMVNSNGLYSGTYTANSDDIIGYCINDRFELVATKSITFSIKENSDPLLIGRNPLTGKKEFIAPPFLCTTMYPEADPSNGMAVVVRTREQLKKDFHLSDKDLEKFDGKDQRRNEAKNMHQGERDKREKVLERNTYERLMQSR